MADFDKSGIMRIIKIFLNQTVKGHFDLGNINIDSNVLGFNKKGYYYL